MLLLVGEEVEFVGELGGAHVAVVRLPAQVHFLVHLNSRIFNTLCFRIIACSACSPWL